MGCRYQIQKCHHCRACLMWLPSKGWSGCKYVAKSVTNPIFWVPKQLGKSQPPAFQSPSVLHPIIIIQHPWELICFKWWVTHLQIRWYDRSNSSGMYIRLNGVFNWGQVLNWGKQTFRHYIYTEHVIVLLYMFRYIWIYIEFICMLLQMIRLYLVIYAYYHVLGCVYRYTCLYLVV